MEDQSGYKDFHELSIWRDSFELLMKVYRIADGFPLAEKFALTSQILRSANSVPANIAESHGRYSYNDKIRVLYIARGEIYETRSHLAVACGRRYVSEEIFTILNDGYCTLAKKLNAYINSLFDKSLTRRQ